MCGRSRLGAVAVAHPVINVQPPGAERRPGAGRHTSMKARLSVAGPLSARRRPLLALAVVLSLAGCVTGAFRAATAAGCTEWAQEVSLTGQVNWQVLLESGRESELGPDAAPLAVGGVAVFAQTGMVHGLRLAGGQAGRRYGPTPAGRRSSGCGAGRAWWSSSAAGAKDP